MNKYPIDREAICKRLRTWRDKSSYSRKKLADRLKVSPETIKNYEGGKSFPSISVLLEYSCLMDCSLDRLVFDVPKRLPSELDFDWAAEVISDEKWEKLLPFFQLSRSLYDPDFTMSSEASRTFYSLFECITGTYRRVHNTGEILIPNSDCTYDSGKLGYRLNRIREDQDEKIEPFSKNILIGADTLSRWENGQQEPTLEPLTRYLSDENDGPFYLSYRNCSLDFLLLGFNRDYGNEANEILSPFSPHHQSALLPIFLELLHWLW